MSVIMIEGWDKYGPLNSNNTATGVPALLTAGEWTSAAAATWSIVAGLSATGQAISGTVGTNALVKTLPASYSRLIGGFRFSATLGGTFNAGIAFQDTGSVQCSIAIAPSGLISLRNGNLSGTAIATSAASISTNSIHYLEWDITFGNSANFQCWLDGVSLFSGTTGDTTTTANNTANQIVLGGASGASIVMTYDDLYLFDSTGAINNAVLLTSPRVETSFPTSDGAVQFGFGAGILGSSVQRVAGSNTSGANIFYVRSFIPAVSCTLNSISVLTGTGASATVNQRPIVYADNAGVPGTLMSAGATVTGTTANTVITLPLTTPQALVAGTRYWLGLMNDISVTNANASQDGLATGRSATSTFASGAPGTAPATSTGVVTLLLWGNLTGVAVNYDQVNNQPPDGIYSYVLDSVVGHEDLYNFAPLSVPPSQVYAVAIKANCAKSDAGTKTVSMRVKSGATDSGGSSTGQALGTSFGWLTSLFERDPNGNIAWTGANVNAAQAGFRVDS